MARKIILIVFLSSLSVALFSQAYDQVIGIRGGFPNSISYKKTLKQGAVAEGIASFYQRGFLLTGLYNIQNPTTIEGEAFDWYYGGGAHVGFFNNRNVNFLGEVSGTNSVVVGVDGIIGLEYTFTDIPLNLSLDYKPAFNFIGYTGFWFDHISLGVRYVID